MLTGTLTAKGDSRQFADFLEDFTAVCCDPIFDEFAAQMGAS